MATKRGPKNTKLSNLKAKSGKKIDASQVRGGRKAGGGEEYLVVKMNDILVSGYQSGGSEGSNAK